MRFARKEEDRQTLRQTLYSYTSYQAMRPYSLFNRYLIPLDIVSYRACSALCRSSPAVASPYWWCSIMNEKILEREVSTYSSSTYRISKFEPRLDFSFIGFAYYHNIEADIHHYEQTMKKKSLHLRPKRVIFRRGDVRIAYRNSYIPPYRNLYRFWFSVDLIRTSEGKIDV